jgi:hypothetical protein
VINFIETSPHQLSALCVVRANRAIHEAATDPVQWFLAIVDLHRALNSALVAALRGSAGIGAYPLQLRRLWLDYFEQSRTKNVAVPHQDRVESFLELLSRAQKASPDLQGEPLKLGSQELKDLEKLNSLRDDIEHVKPTAWSLEVVGLPRIAKSAGTALAHLYLLPPVYMHLRDTELAGARLAISEILER